MQKAIIESTLRKCGLTSNEAKVYLAMVKLGSASVTDITKTSEVHRSNVYDTVERLMEKGLVSAVMQSNKKYFEAADPAHIHDLVKEQEKELLSVLPTLKTEFKLAKNKQEVHHFKGPEGVKTVLREMNKYKTYDAFGISENLSKIVPYYFPHWVRERLEKGLFGRMIKSFDDRLATPKVVGDQNYKKLFEVRNVPPEMKTPAATFIFADKVAIILETEDPLAILMDNKDIAKAYQLYFDMLWKTAKKEK